ncbi:hypothetical protein [Streptomyces sp. NBC_00989]|uniref:hypothetical protein n=1 Tax=Streptomyces sp. NBC_00989 TaxID=2903705 RepID=UPI0038698981|nr:hypothetical protein OG714_17375 [Streptomyces sp. NBC_00989]
MTVLVSVWGAAPGVGKSTLCAGLSRSLAGAGLRVDHFREEEILSRPQFAAVAEEFGATGAVGPETLVAATARFGESVPAHGDDVVIADALVPFVPTLPAMGHGEEAIDAFMTDLASVLAPVRPVVVFLDGDTGTALSRAGEREGPKWLDWNVGVDRADELTSGEVLGALTQGLKPWLAPWLPYTPGSPTPLTRPDGNAPATPPGAVRPCPPWT